MLNYYPVFEAAIKNSFIDKTVPTILKSIEECKEKVRQYEAKQEMNAKSKTKMPTTPSLQSRRAESDYEDDEGDEEEGENDYDSGDSFIAEDDQDMGSIELKVTPKKKNKKKLQQEQEEINEMERPNIPGNKSLDKSPAFLYVDVESTHLDHLGVLQLCHVFERRVHSFLKFGQRSALTE
jgi:hypothetical protein